MYTVKENRTKVSFYEDMDFLIDMPDWENDKWIQIKKQLQKQLQNKNIGIYSATTWSISSFIVLLDGYMNPYGAV